MEQMMTCYGYARVSSTDQDYTLQEKALRGAGCEIVRAEKASGTSRTSRNELELLLEFLQAGDTLIVTRIDRLARSIKDLQDIVYLLKKKNVTLKATEQPIDTRTAAGKAFLDMLGVFAEFETNLRRERQLRVLLLQNSAVLTPGEKKPLTTKRSNDFVLKKT
jgi:DNA invertase Pin-like site-specific DNA recombinase